MKRFTLRLTTPLHTTLHLSQLLHLLTSQLSKLKKMFPFELSQNANIHHLQTNITSPTANSNIHHLPNTTNTTPLRCLVDGGHNIIHYPSFNSPWPNKSVPLTNQCFPSGHPPSTCKLISAIPHLHTYTHHHYYFREPPPHSSDPILLPPIQPSPPLHFLYPFHRPPCCTWPLLQHNLHPVLLPTSWQQDERLYSLQTPQEVPSPSHHCSIRNYSLRYAPLYTLLSPPVLCCWPLPLCGKEELPLSSH